MIIEGIWSKFLEYIIEVKANLQAASNLYLVSDFMQEFSLLCPYSPTIMPDFQTVSPYNYA